MTAPHDTREAVEALAQWHYQQAADYGWHHAKHSLRDQHAATGQMLARLLARAVAAEAALATARRAAGLGCDANAGLEHSVMAQGQYRFCYRCGETITQPDLRERCRIAEAERDEAKAALAAARADALKEAATAAFIAASTSKEGRPVRDAILALIPAPEAQTHD